MGLGGSLMCSAVVKNIYRHFGKKCKYKKDNKHEIISKNNPLWGNGTFEYPYPGLKLYNKSVSEDRVEFLTNNHIVEFFCKQVGISKNIDIDPELYLDSNEINNAKKILCNFPSVFCCIEPHSKSSWMTSRSYSFSKYQNIVNALKDLITFVQVGAPRAKKLDNVLYMNGQTTFRETYEIFRHSQFFLSTEGGLVHLARAAKLKSFVIYTSYQYPSLTMYPENTCIDISLYRNELLGFRHHDLYLKEVEKHDENIIISQLKKYL
jgi:ADP-heptose:LPS heptosyltransferase